MQNTTPTETKFSAGDAHPSGDGRVFLAYRRKPGMPDKEEWESAEQRTLRTARAKELAKARYAASKDSNPAAERPYKYGDLHPSGDGRTFKGYRGATGEQWETAEAKEKRLSKVAEYQAKLRREAGIPERREGLDVEARKAYHKEYVKTEAGKASIKRTYEAIKKDKFAKRVERRKADPVFRCRLWASRQNQRLLQYMLGGVKPHAGSVALLGCSPAHLKAHLEAKFTEGMTWMNYGKWHIDHVKPLASAKTESEVYPLCHYTNLQPLWAEDNLRKGDAQNPLDPESPIPFIP
jgi:hypothetical protein